ncbi:DUF2000 domain-containing protein [Chelatococcus daeguensis]|uniref:DUF2000 domain-containing protein n=1 Tax=Chelatococcus daeguensis TaxID=444444 RepID=UPI0007AB7A18|nr:DUF2000 domain-containing protein [Chelatococcus daeguensis]KZE36033.1 hypothetical protein AVW15_11385 [Chelatococcus daeguensis]MBM3084173.1 DUF2000 domain-containing protein [Chelatococcus daeguensis]
MKFDTKIAIAVREDLAVWQKLNMVAFLASGVATGRPSTIGEPYRDGSGRQYWSMFGQPVVVLTAADGAELKAAYERAWSRGLGLAVFTEQLFATGHDAANRAAVAAVPSPELDLAGFAVHGPRNDVDRALKGLGLHR